MDSSSLKSKGHCRVLGLLQTCSSNILYAIPKSSCVLIQSVVKFSQRGIERGGSQFKKFAQSYTVYKGRSSRSCEFQGWPFSKFRVCCPAVSSAQPLHQPPCGRRKGLGPVGVGLNLISPADQLCELEKNHLRLSLSSPWKER